MRFPTLFLVSIVCQTLAAQGSMRNWHFGMNASVDMLAGPPAFQIGSAIGTGESCVTVSDVNGDLLFYSEGMNVWNVNHATMPNGTGLLCNSGDWQQGVATCPWPGMPNKHLLFHTDIDHTLYWSTVDMSLNGGTGDVINKNTFLATGIGEAMTIARHGNGTEYWLVVRDFAADLFKVYPITNAGVGGLSSSVACGMDNIDFTGMVRFNHAHTWMAATMRGGFGNGGLLGLFPFNATTGVLGAGTVIPQYAPWGLEFSCSDRRLYLSHNDLVPIQQFDMLNGSPSNILTNPVDATIPITAFDMANAPDNRIYFVWNDGWNRGARVLGAILEPAEAGLACNMVDSAVVWTYPFAANSTCLPSFIQQQASVVGNCTPVSVSSIEAANELPVLSNTIIDNGAWVRWPAQNEGYQLTVISATGSMVRTEQVRSREHWLDAGALRAGVYVLLLTGNDDGAVSSLKFIKE